MLNLVGHLLPQQVGGVVWIRYTTCLDTYKRLPLPFFS